MNRREFIKSGLVALLALSPIGRWAYEKWLKRWLAPKPYYSKFAFPLIRRVYPELLASQWVSVQPMTIPSGLIFYMDFYGKPPRKRKHNARYLKRRERSLRNRGIMV